MRNSECIRKFISTILKYPFFKFILKFILFYTLFNIFFYGYVGVLDPRGKFHWVFLSEFDLVQAILESLKYPIKWLLEFGGYQTRIYKTGVGILNGPGAFIAFPCLGIGVMITYISLILSFPGKNKIMYLIIGIFVVHLLNIFRILGVILIQFKSRDYIETAHTIFNLLAYSVILLLFYFYTKRVD